MSSCKFRLCQRFANHFAASDGKGAAGLIMQQGFGGVAEAVKDGGGHVGG